MAIVFPPIESASPEGLLAIGGNLDTETLLTAYQQGIFPWPISPSSPLTWFTPDPRGIIFTKDFHIPKSFNKFLNKCPFSVTFNKQFSEVINQCAKATRKHEVGTWITKEIEEGYCKFFDAGYAYSVEVLEDNKLVGGLYGVCIGGYLTGESMFHTKTNASKLALYSLIQKLEQNSIDWLDTQMVTPVIESLGGKNIPREEFLKVLNFAVAKKISREDIFN